MINFSKKLTEQLNLSLPGKAAQKLMMEFIVRPHLHDLRYYLLIASLFGFLASMPLLFLGLGYELLLIGALTGLLVGLTIYERSRDESNA